MQQTKQEHSHGHSHAAILAVLVRIAEAGTEGDLCTDDATAAVEPVFNLVHVHAATQALGSAVGFAHQLCNACGR